MSQTGLWLTLPLVNDSAGCNTGKNLCEIVHSSGTAGQRTFGTGAVLPIAESSLRCTSSSARRSADRASAAPGGNINKQGEIAASEPVF